MNNFFEKLFDRIDEEITYCDEELARQFPFWAAAPDWLKYVIVVVTPIAILILGMMAFEIGVILLDMTLYVLQSPRLFQAAAIALLAFAVLLSEIQRRGVIVTIIWAVVLLLLLRYAAEQVGVETKYIDTVLKTIVDVPRIIIENVRPFIKEGVSGLVC